MTLVFVAIEGDWTSEKALVQSLHHLRLNMTASLLFIIFYFLRHLSNSFSDMFLSLSAQKMAAELVSVLLEKLTGCLAWISLTFCEPPSIFLSLLALTAGLFRAPTATLYCWNVFFFSSWAISSTVLPPTPHLRPDNNHHFCSPLNFLSIDPTVTQSLPPTLSQKIGRDVYSRRTNEKLFYEIWKSALWLTLPRWLQRQYLKAGPVESNILSNFRTFISLIQ